LYDCQSIGSCWSNVLTTENSKEASQGPTGTNMWKGSSAWGHAWPLTIVKVVAQV
jgi:hypothetical protein